MNRVLNKLTSFLVIIVLWSAATTAQDQGVEQAPAPPPVPAADPEQAITDLQQAYQKEYAFLTAQQSDLRQRLEAFRQRSQQESNQAETRIDALQGAIIGLQSRGDRINDLLVEADRNIQSIEDNRGTLDATYQQATSTLEQQGLEQFAAEDFEQLDDINKIDQLFTAAADQIGQLGEVRAEQGSFYLLDGTQVDGTVVRVGNIAAYGVSGDNGGVLAPAGEGRLKLWEGDTVATAKALAAGQRPEGLPVFLFESLNKSIEETEKRGLIGTIDAGGPIAWIIVVLGLIALLMAVLRFIFLRSASSSTASALSEVSKLVQDGEHNRAIEACKKRGAVGRVMSSAVRNLKRDREHLEDIVSEAILHENAHLNRFGSVILVIAAVAPLLGLLGTVTGMITTFDIITEFGTGDPKLLSGGISIALITTEVGLAVAIPALILGNLLSGWAESIKDNMEKAALRVINIEQERRHDALATA